MMPLQIGSEDEADRFVAVIDLGSGAAKLKIVASQQTPLRYPERHVL
jgi:hypothetical protein